MDIVAANGADYLAELLQLQPNGPYWPTDPNSLWVALLTAIAQEYARVDQNAVGLINEAFPDTTDILLPNWMAECGLPDACSDPAETTAQQRRDVLAKLLGRGGQSIAYLESVAAALGFTSTITNATIFSADIAVADGALFDDSGWGNIFFVSTTPTPSNTASFECRINQIKPAHTTGIYSYP